MKKFLVGLVLIFVVALPLILLRVFSDNPIAPIKESVIYESPVVLDIIEVEIKSEPIVELPPEKKIRKILSESRGLEVNLTTSEILLYEDGVIVDTLPILHQSKKGKWFQVPTGHYRIGIKEKEHLSSLFPVTMPNSIQFYEDFFMHGMPYYEDGTIVSNNFTGGCLRFEDDVSKRIYDFIETGDEVVSYTTLDNLVIKEGLHPPVDIEDFWVRQMFNNPNRNSYNYGGTDDLRFDYYQHTGVDFAPYAGVDNPPVYAIADGTLVVKQLNNGFDHGLGNTIIIEHEIFGETIYALYAHMTELPSYSVGSKIGAGEIIGHVGNSGYGCDNHWRIGPDGCDENGLPDTHLHFEIKESPVLENPSGGNVCDTNGIKRPCYGYTPSYPYLYGYLDPIQFIGVSSSSEQPKTAQIREFISRPDIEDIIKKYAQIYSVAFDLAIDLAHYESGLSATAINSNSSARGLYQFLEKSTWGNFCEGDIYSPEDNARCAMKIIGENQTGIRHWTADLATRKMLLVKNYVYCMAGKNKCYLK